MFHELVSPFIGTSLGDDLIYVAYLAFMWGTLGLANYLDVRGTLRSRRRS
jgi:hypothetical protein